MRFALIATLILALAVPAVAGVTPELEKEFTSDGGWRFAGPAGRDQGPDIVEIAADGDYTVVFYSGGGAPKYGGGTATVVPIGTPSWGHLSDTDRWPDAVPVGNAFLTGWSGLTRQYNIRGTGADSLGITRVTATKVLVSCSKER